MERHAADDESYARGVDGVDFTPNPASDSRWSLRKSEVLAE